MSCAFPTISGGSDPPQTPLLSFPGGPIPPDPPWEGLPVPPFPPGVGLDTNEGLTLTHRVAVLDEPFDNLGRPRRSDRPLSATRHHGTQLRGRGHHRAGRR